MKKQRNPRLGVVQTSVDETFQDFLDEAEICCEHARLAARLKRYEASRGLFITAAALYERAIKAAGSSYPALENRLREIELEMAAYAELAKSMARPLLNRAPVVAVSDVADVETVGIQSAEKWLAVKPRSVAPARQVKLSNRSLSSRSFGI